MPADGRLRVEVVWRALRPPLPAARCRWLLQEVAGRVRGGRRASRRAPSAPALTILFAGDATMRSLNARFRGHTRPTDVLSFPAAPPRCPITTVEGPYLGDLAIGVPAARRQARRHGHSLAREVEMLLLHGYLHLVGYDHERDHGEMVRLERRLRRSLGLARRGSAA